MSRRKRIRSSDRRYQINSQADIRTFNDWDVLEHRSGSDTSTIQAEIENLKAVDEQQEQQISELTGTLVTWTFEDEDGAVIERTVRIY